jgi:hypothetical protein
MTVPSESYLKVAYDLRPAKQVERRMMLETFQVLSQLGFPIDEYQYTGFGSVYFADFILFHKLLGIRKMLSLEINDKIRKRIKFNRPFGSVEVKIGSIEDEIPKLSSDLRHLLWLDYDSILVEGHLRELYAAASKLPRHSLILVTVDCEPPVKGGTPQKWRDYFRLVAGQYLGTLNRLTDFTNSNLVTVNRDILTSVLKSGLVSREVRYIPLFSFSYADGHEMLTIGGMIGTLDDESRIAGVLRTKLPYLRLKEDDAPFRINVPKLTRKERVYLDKKIPIKSGWRPKHFEIPDDFLQEYEKVYRYLPAYAELLL